MSGSESSSLVVRPLRLCEVALERLEVQGVAVALISSPQARSLLAASGELAGVVEDLQFSLGEGPCLEAFLAGSAALEPDLATTGRTRWPLFAEAALSAGVGAVFAFPLQLGSTRFGVLDVARASAGMLGDDQLADAQAFADIAADTVLRMQSLALEDEIADELGGIGSERIVVHQATGMVSVQAGIAVEDALARLRAHAFAVERPLHEVASDVVARRLNFRPRLSDDGLATEGSWS
jgi:hypothetical protein